MPQQSLPSEKVVIYVDSREMHTRIVDILRKQCDLREKQLAVADFLLSDRVGCERKTVSDFLQSIVDGRLFKQLVELKEGFEKPLLIIEGDSLFEQRNIHENAINGALASIAIEFSIPMIWTKNQMETAHLLLAIAKREQLGSSATVSIRGQKRVRSENEEQEFLVAGLPGINTVHAKRLLEHFGTPEKLFSAHESELKKLHGIGNKKARRIRQLLERTYEKSILE
ncbi:MAG: hypothetical protein HZB66_01495 [Candidatus Aenigmarchaeota archaeon]|nr:hypothetical protein [Candidatus Aenigmarchaeota archaeon]